MNRLFAIAMMVVFLAGCAMVSQADLLEMERSVDANIIVGQTTRAEVLARYGTPKVSAGNSKARRDQWVYDSPGWTTSNLSILTVIYEDEIVSARDFTTTSKRQL